MLLDFDPLERGDNRLHQLAYALALDDELAYHGFHGGGHLRW